MLGLLDLGVDIVDDVDLSVDASMDGADIAGHADAAGHVHHSAGAWMWSMFSVRNITAALTFFGLTGMALRAQGASPMMQLSVAVLAGALAMYSVHWLMRAVLRMATDSTMQVQRAVGQVGAVYLPIPPAKTGSGKVHLSVQGRLEEFEAVTTWPDKLPAGATVVVIAVVGNETLQVEPAAITVDPAAKAAKSV
jgi:membrane protein implicated in regulation of membrane protease activity